MICENCGGEIYEGEPHVTAPPNKRGIKCLILPDVEKWIGWIDAEKKHRDFLSAYDPDYDPVLS